MVKAEEIHLWKYVREDNHCLPPANSFKSCSYRSPIYFLSFSFPPSLCSLPRHAPPPPQLTEPEVTELSQTKYQERLWTKTQQQMELLAELYQCKTVKVFSFLHKSMLRKTELS